jgi:hypothetical protein
MPEAFNMDNPLQAQRSSGWGTSLSPNPEAEINLSFLVDFELYLLAIRGYSRNMAVTVMKKLRHIIEVALNKEWIYRNPFKELKLQWQKVDRGYLTQSELETMIDFRFEDERLEQARDIFIFCSFTGLSYTDVKHLTNGNIQPSFDGKLWIRGNRKKTGTEYHIPVLNIPKMILEKYRGRTKGDLALPVFDIQTYNILRKQVAQLCGIDKRPLHRFQRWAEHILLHLAIYRESIMRLEKSPGLQNTFFISGVLCPYFHFNHLESGVKTEGRYRVILFIFFCRCNTQLPPMQHGYIHWKTLSGRQGAAYFCSALPLMPSFKNKNSIDEKLKGQRLSQTSRQR